MDYINKYGIQYLYHMTHIGNLYSILEYGLLSHKEAHRQKLIEKDISNQSVQDRRRNIEIDGSPLHHYVCLYFSPRNPMLYVSKGIQHEIIFIAVDPRLILHSGTIFLDGNAAAEDTRFFKGASLLGNLDWNIINAVYWPNYPDGRRIKCAEVLVPTKVDTKHFMRILCYDNNQLNQIQLIQDLALEHDSITVEIKKEIYF